MRAGASVPYVSEIVQKKVFHLPSFTTATGHVLRDVRIGYETYGTLNAAGDNAIIHCHFLTGDGHLAGKYDPTDKKAGVADGFVGKGQAIDTKRYFVVSADLICNTYPELPPVTTTGPATIDPQTGKRYGMSFPVITHGDQVRIHKALLDSLGVKKLKMVYGSSMGGSLAIQWGVEFPDFVERVVSINGRGLRTTSRLVAMYDCMAEAIKSDPNWNKGDYYDRAKPMAGLTLAMRLLAYIGHGSSWFEENGGRDWAVADQNPLDSLSHDYMVESKLDYISETKAAQIDANSFLYLMRAEQLFAIEKPEEIARIKCPVLMLYEGSDIFAPTEAELLSAVQRLKAQGTPVKAIDVRTGAGHYWQISHRPLVYQLLSDFLETDAASMDGLKPKIAS